MLTNDIIFALIILLAIKGISNFRKHYRRSPPADNVISFSAYRRRR